MAQAAVAVVAQAVAVAATDAPDDEGSADWPAAHPRRWVVLGGVVALMTIAQFTRLYRPELVPQTPNQVGVFITPFRQVTEVVDGVARSRLGCVDDRGVFALHPLTSQVLGAWSGSHHRKIALYNVLSDAVVASDVVVRRVLRVALCDDVEVRNSLGCSGRGAVVTRTADLHGGSRVVEATCD